MASYLDNEGLKVFWNLFKAKTAQKQDNLNSAQLDAVNSGIDSNAVNKLKTIESNAQVNVQSDWNATSGDAFIKNKPSIGNGYIDIKIKGESQGKFYANADSGLEVNLTKDMLGISNALQFKGISVTALSTGSVTNPIKLSDGTSLTCIKGYVVLYSSKEFLFDGTSWTEIGDEESYALRTTQIVAGNALKNGGSLSDDITLRHGWFIDSSLPVKLDFYKIQTEGTGHLQKYDPVTSSDIIQLGIPSRNTNQRISVTVGTEKKFFKENNTVFLNEGSDSRTTITADNTNNTITLQTPTIQEATTSADGLISAKNKDKLSKIENFATKVIVDAEPTTNSTNAVKTSAVAKIMDLKLSVDAKISAASINEILNS